MLIRTIQCDVCGEECTEKNENDGWPGWGALQGIALDGRANPSLCPKHLAAAATFLDDLKQEIESNGMDRA